jgi:phosphotransferase system HPr-like phosphotransfer protein
MSDETIENVASGVSITAKLKRGSGTRDQDEIKIKAKGTTAEEAKENMAQVLPEAKEWAEELREIQPEEE